MTGFTYPKGTDLPIKLNNEKETELFNGVLHIRFKESLKKEINEAMENDEILTVNHIMKLHPEMNITEAAEYLKFCHANTIRWTACYGKGQIIYPLWKQYKTNV